MLVWPSHPKTLFYLSLRFWTQNSAHSTVHCEFKIHQPWYLSLLRGHSSHWWFSTCLELSKFLARDSQHIAHLHQGFRVPLCLPARSPRTQQKCTANPSKVPVQLKENHLFCQFSERLTVHVHKHLCKPSAGGNAVTRTSSPGTGNRTAPCEGALGSKQKEATARSQAGTAFRPPSTWHSLTHHCKDVTPLQKSFWKAEFSPKILAIRHIHVLICSRLPGLRQALANGPCCLHSITSEE